MDTRGNFGHRYRLPWSILELDRIRRTVATAIQAWPEIAYTVAFGAESSTVCFAVPYSAAKRLDSVGDFEKHAAMYGYTESDLLQVSVHFEVRAGEPCGRFSFTTANFDNRIALGAITNIAAAIAHVLGAEREAAEMDYERWNPSALWWTGTGWR